MTKFSKEVLKELRLFIREKQTWALPGLPLKGCHGQEEVGWFSETLRQGAGPHA